MLKGEMRISRVSSNMRDDFVRISFLDELSHTRFLSAEMSLEEFAKALFSSSAECEFELHAKHVGMKRENKQEWVQIRTSGYSLTDEEKAAALAPFMVDGWFPRSSDMGNQHRYSMDVDDNPGYTVVFFRYVEVEDD